MNDRGASTSAEARTARETLARLRKLVERPRVGRTGAWSSWTDDELLELPRLYRHACTLLARLEVEGENPRVAEELRGLIASAHGLLAVDGPRAGEPWTLRALRFLLEVAPRAIRAEARLLAFSFALLYGLAFLAWLAVRHDLDLAYSLLAPQVVDNEIAQLGALAEGQSFRGNFSFGLGESPVAAGSIMLHNLGVGVVFFASALLPPLYLYLLGSNALMLGTYTAVAGHWGQAGAISSIIWTHGVLEIQSIVLVGTAGLVLVRAWVKPGASTRGQALLRESRRALELFAPVFPLLVVAGVIEGFVSPHAPLAVRLSVAVGSGLVLVAWVAFGGRGRSGRDHLEHPRT